MSARIAVLISGTGRNLQALIEACADGRIDGHIVCVLSNRADAAGLERAQQVGIATEVLSHRDYESREAFDTAMIARLLSHTPDIVVMAGFMRILTPAFIAAFAGRMLNIHPSLLPRHPGLRTHEAVLAAGERKHGATVHFVTEELDGGPLIIQDELIVRADDDVMTLAQRVMSGIELKIYPQAVAWMARGELELAGRQVRFKGQILAGPLGRDAVEEKFR
ncbi:phosphoribosylglycinamide formyltransferase [Solimonas marina]|uniref:Phosphoribosylglycinamide formyltransferase n=1 Tax=Solimonas marina TaxID=2714601 RepID=A0A970B795_9GAMM|nr:phosphoribosylglycinamide formyltransferase [Solimonas marina]NKF23648.1 phosphoribosylglycinamide formyltransferase [Solimonas marina]